MTLLGLQVLLALLSVSSTIALFGVGPHLLGGLMVGSFMVGGAWIISQLRVRLHV